MDNSIRILHLDDHPHERNLVRETLEQASEDFRLTEVTSHKKFSALLNENRWDIVLSDFDAAGYEGLLVIDAVLEKNLSIPVIIVTAKGSEEIAAESIRRGAKGYVQKTAEHISHLPTTIQNALKYQQSKAALQESERILNETGALARIAGWEHDLTTGKAKWTRSLYDIIEIEPGKPVPGVNEHLSYYPPEYREILETAYNKAVYEGIPFDLDLQVKSAKGRLLWCRVIGEPVLKDSRCIKMRGTFQDITERKHTEAKLKQSEELLNAAQELTKSGGWEWDIVNQKMTWTRGTFRIHDLNPDELSDDFNNYINKSIECYRPVDRPRIMGAFNKCITEGTPYDIEVPFTSTKGRSMWIRTMAFAVWSEGKIVKVVGNIIDITDRKRVEEELRRERDFVKNLVETAQTIILHLDNEGRIVSFNPYMEELSGYSIDEVRGKDWFTTFLPSKDRNTIQSLFKQAIGNIQIRGNVNPILTKDGNEHYIEWYSKTLRNKAGETVGVLATGRDITDHKYAVEAVKASEEKYRTYVEKAPNGIFIVDTRGKYIDVNEAACRMTGYTRDELLKISIMGIAGKDNIEIARQTFEELAGTGEVHDEIILRRKDGVFISASLDAVEISGKRYMAFCSDITNRKQAEKDLKLSEQRYQVFFENTTVGFYRTAPDGRVLMANPAYLKITGYKSLEELKDRNVINRGYISKESAVGFLQRMRLDGHVKGFEAAWRRKNGSMIWIRESAHSVSDSEGNLLYYEGTFEDITERKQAEEELMKISEQLRNLATHLQSAREEERTAVAREIHDELGQVLTALKIDLSVLEKGFSSDQKLLLQTTKAMAKLINHTADTVSRISSELRPGLLDDLGLSVALDWQVEEFQKRTGIKCQKSVSIDDSILHRELSTALFRIFQETLTNIARHSKATSVIVSLVEIDDHLRLTVEDNGIGITDEQLEDSRSYGLLGMRERVKYFGGEFTITGKENKGTTVIATFPLIRQER